jgi:signal transduction histidine kinase
MELSQSDFSLLEGLAQKLARAPATEVIAAEIHQALQQICRFSEVRVVVAQQPSGWREWIAGLRVTGVRDSEAFPGPPENGTVAYFDPDNREAGFLWMSTTEHKCGQALHLIAPQAGTAIMLNAALKRSRRSTIQERELARETLRSRDEERRRIAWELHDDLGQSLASLKLNLKWVEDVVRARGIMDDAVNELSAARDAVGTILGKVRDLSHTLYPSILDTLGFSAAIKELLYQSTRRTVIEAFCKTSGAEKPLPKEVAVGLYRCCQEAVNNALRHSGASTITVDIVFADAEVHVTVEDNGRGFDPGSLHESGGRMMSSGFWTIRQRVADLGGAFRVSTALGNGAAVEITIPTNLRVFDARSKNKAANR